MVGGHLFPLWKRGIKGDLIGWWGGFLCSMGAVLLDDRSNVCQKSPLAPLFQRGVIEDLPNFEWLTTICCVFHTHRVQPKLMGNDEYSKRGNPL